MKSRPGGTYSATPWIVPSTSPTQASWCSRKKQTSEVIRMWMTIFSDQSSKKSLSAGCQSRMHPVANGSTYGSCTRR